MIQRYDVSCNLDNLKSGRYVLYEDHLDEIKKLEGWLRYLWDNWDSGWQREGMSFNDTETEIESYIKAMGR